jgi:transcriptional accessory protein Tex/SPT6/NACalpha-BTF3-like transcription factor
MSSSIRRSSDYETDEILPEDTEEKVGVDGDQTLTDSDDVEETEKDGNNYQYDGFVVPDDFDEEGTEEFEETEQESVRKRRKRKQKDYRLDKDDTDLLEENVNASHNDRFKRLKKARKDETEDDGLLDDEEDEDDHSAYRKEQRIQSSQDLRLINQLFNDGTELEDNEKLMLGDGDEMDVEKTDNYAGIFEPEEIQEKYQTEEDRLIIEKDLPERLQLRFKNRPMPDNPELIEETNWLVERIMLKNNITSKESVSLKSKVHKVLEYLRLAGCEIMYIWTHKKHEITSDKKAEFEKHEYELKLSDLWYIYDLDMEWMHIYQRRKYIKNLLEKLESFLPTTKSLKSSFQSTYDLKVLQYYLDYVEFHLKKFVDDQELRQLVGEDMDDFDQKEPAFKRIRKRNFARECMKYHLHDVANQIAIAPDHLSENLVYSDQKNKPKLITETPDKIATEYSNPDVAIIDQPVKTLTTLCEYMALELYNHPMIRKQLRKTYNEKVTISTKPTDKGQNEVTIYNFYYPCKRIKNMKPLDFGNSLWLMMIEAEMKGLIEISLKLPWQKDGEKDEQKVEKKDEIRQRLLNLYLHDPKGKKTEPEEMNSINAWNIVREETISKLLKSFIYPSFERALKEELTESSERYVVNSAARAFKDSINIQPYKKKKADGESEPDPGPYRVLSCIIEPQTSNAHFVQVDENGELMDHMTCKYLARHPSDDYSLRQLYNKERETLKNFMVKSYPGLIVIGATCLACKKVKIDLGNLAEEALNEIKARDPTSTATVPWVMWGLTSVPNAFAQSYKASKQFPEFEFHVKEAISLGRLVQDPLAETLNLWAERIKENSLLYISYHTMQVFIF